VTIRARAVIWIDGLLIVAEQSRRGRKELSLPGGRVNDHESVGDALKREVAEETGLDVELGQLVYVSETVQPVGATEVELIFLARPSGVPQLSGRFQTIDLSSEQRPVVRPPILEQIASDARTGWRDTPRWLGDLRAGAGATGVTGARPGAPSRSRERSR
jgi:ADP-ribose pyrophosphatase YjhB (NUDIX family)